MQAALKVMSGQRTVPNIYIGDTHIVGMGIGLCTAILLLRFTCVYYVCLIQIASVLAS